MKSMYQSDLSEEEWGLVSHHLEHKDPRGKKPIHSKCAIVNAVLYISKIEVPMAHAAKGLPTVENCLRHITAYRLFWSRIFGRVHQSCSSGWFAHIARSGGTQSCD
jgi:hypothetical protein